MDRRQLAATSSTLLASLALGLPTASRAEGEPSGPGPKLSVAQIESKLSRIPVCALVNPEDQPYLNSNGVGYFYLDPRDALLELRILQQKGAPEAELKVVQLDNVYFPLVMGEQGDLGGTLLLRPSRKQVVQANRALQYSDNPGSLLPKSLDESKGQVPLFYSERVSLVDGAGRSSFPFFLSKEDLDASFVALQRAEGSGAKRSEAEADGMPVGLVRIATLDGMVSQMKSGEVDLSQAVLVGAADAIALTKKLTGGA